MTARPGEAAGGGPARPTIRLDKWLWQARFLKSRTLAAVFVQEGRLRVNGHPVDKPARAVGAGDVLTFALRGQVRVVRILDLGERRGPASEAQALYEDLAPPGPRVAPEAAPGPAGPPALE